MLCNFDCVWQYVGGTVNVFSDALSQIYSSEPSGIVRAQSEYVAETLDDKEDIEPSSLVPIEPMVALFQLTEPLYTTAEIASAEPRVLRPRPPKPVPDPKTRKPRTVKKVVVPPTSDKAEEPPKEASP